MRRHLWIIGHLIIGDTKSVTIERANDLCCNCAFNLSNACLYSWKSKLVIPIYITFRTINRTFTMNSFLNKNIELVKILYISVCKHLWYSVLQYFADNNAIEITASISREIWWKKDNIQKYLKTIRVSFPYVYIYIYTNIYPHRGLSII